MKNKYDIMIKECCASCRHLDYIPIQRGVSTCRRVCAAGGGEVKGSGICAAWDMHPKYDNAGMCGGAVKRKEWIQYIYDTRMSGDVQGRVLSTEEWEALHGSRYYNL